MKLYNYEKAKLNTIAVTRNSVELIDLFSFDKNHSICRNNARACHIYNYANKYVELKHLIISSENLINDIAAKRAINNLLQ